MRARLTAAVSRVWRWEFWPPWVFYLPLAPWIAWLALRHRGLTTLTAANPGIPHGGIVGESKFEILSRLPNAWVVPTTLIPAGQVDARVSRLAEEVERRGWSYPLVLKPDAGERGAGVRLVRNVAAAWAYLGRVRAAALAQAYHAGPREAGIFYVRMPGAERGRIFSITDKVFPVVEGDGASTVEALIWRDGRYRMQARRFLARLNGQSGRVPRAGERMTLGMAGNHCQGTMFRDGSHLMSAELERRIDAIARALPGFFFGRFDVRYADAAELRAGRGFAIVELNGATSESTNIYDPAWPLWRAYRVLFEQWRLAYAIGAANRRRGHAATPLRQLLRDLRRHYRMRTDLIAD